jgi:hypothetical protein
MKYEIDSSQDNESSCQKIRIFVKNCCYVQLLESLNLQSLDTLIRFDAVCLFTDVPVDKAPQVIRSKLHNDDILVEWSVLQVEAIMEMLEVCLRTTYFLVDSKFFQKDGITIGSCLPLTASNIYMDINGTFVFWPHGSKWLQNFLSHLNSLRSSIQFTIEIESDSVIPFLDLLVIREEVTFATKAYRKPTHTGRYLNCKFNH